MKRFILSFLMDLALRFVARDLQSLFDALSRLERRLDGYMTSVAAEILAIDKQLEVEEDKVAFMRLVQRRGILSSSQTDALHVKGGIHNLIRRERFGIPD